MNKKFLAITITLFAIFVFLLAGEVQAGSGDNVSGWAWMDPNTLIGGDPLGTNLDLGWISFNCNNPELPSPRCTNDYGVNINSDGTFSGYAWSRGTTNDVGGVGWIKLDPAWPYPFCPITTCPAGSPDYSARVSDTGKVTGWARVYRAIDPEGQTLGGWDGWILLGPIVKGGADYGVSINTGNGEFSGWAWSDMVIGWIDFEGVKTTFSFNNPPYKPTSGGVTWSGECTYVIAIPTFYWIYDDLENDLQAGYQVRVRTNSNFPVDGQGNPILQPDEFKCGGQVCSAENQSPSFSPIPQQWISWAAYNTNYYWTVRVKDSPDNWSEWSDSFLFNTPAHTYPEPDFTHDPETPSAGEEVTFIDSSVCYNAGNNPYSCKDNAGNRYLWDFGDGNSCDSNINSGCRGDVTHSYEVQDDYTVRLFVTDNLGTCDTTGDTPVSIRLPLPEYKEVPPTIWLEKFFAGIINFFDGFLKI